MFRRTDLPPSPRQVRSSVGPMLASAKSNPRLTLLVRQFDRLFVIQRIADRVL